VLHPASCKKPAGETAIGVVGRDEPATVPRSVVESWGVEPTDGAKLSGGARRVNEARSSSRC
jgi:hypothetical protein